MTQVIQKKPNELSGNEKKQLKHFLKRYYSTINENYISDRLSNTYDYDIVLMKNQGVVLGASYYKIDKLKTPFAKKRLPVVHFGQVLKNEYYKGAVIRRTGHWYVQKSISYFYPIKKIVGVSMVGSPKVFEHFTKLFKNHCPNLDAVKSNNNISITHFLQEVYEKRGVKLKFNGNHCFAHMDFEPIDITKDWERYYKAKNKTINAFFIENGLIKFEGNKIYDNNVALIVCGFRNPMNFISTKKVQLEI